MATAYQENDFDRIKRWGKEFLAGGEEGTGGGTGPPRPANAVQSSSRLAACTRWVGGSSRLAAGPFLARAASGMATVGSRPPGHIAEGPGFLAGHGRRDRGRPRRADAMDLLQ